MPLHAPHLARVIARSLTLLGLPRAHRAAWLLLGTAAVESDLRFLRQSNGGPALGLWQVEPATLTDIERNWLPERPTVRDRLIGLAAPARSWSSQLEDNLPFACAVARIVYLRSPIELPAPSDPAGMARVWKAAYNTELGAGSPSKFMDSWRDRVLPHQAACREEFRVLEASDA